MLAANHATPARPQTPWSQKASSQRALIKHGQLEGRDGAPLTAWGLHTKACVFFSFNLIKELCRENWMQASLVLVSARGKSPSSVHVPQQRSPSQEAHFSPFSGLCIQPHVMLRCQAVRGRL